VLISSRVLSGKKARAGIHLRLVASLEEEEICRDARVQTEGDIS
jgi:hypothetical protein